MIQNSAIKWEEKRTQKKASRSAHLFWVPNLKLKRKAKN